MLLRPRRLFVLLAFGLAMVGGRAGAQTPEDPYEKINRQFYDRQADVDRRYVFPLTQLYHRLTPGPFGMAIHNLVTELSEPVDIINDILQGRFVSARKDLIRLTANATFGLAATIDVAGHHGFPHHDNDFGITLGVWGAKPGAYLYLPFIGPTTLRDALGAGADIGMNPFNFMRFPGRVTLQVSSSILSGLDKRFHAQSDLDAILTGAADPYATLRSVYLQNREAQIRGENAAPELPPLDDPGTAAPAATPSSGATSAAPVPPAPIATAPAAQVPAAPSGSAGAELADLDAPIVTAQPIDLDRAALRLAAAN
jgi:phospholipid-binding lipoprotein MlaA